MKSSFTVSVILLACIGGYFVGRATSRNERPKTPQKTQEVRSENGVSYRLSFERTPLKERFGRSTLSVDKAKQMTSSERAELLVRAASLSDPARQASILCGLIPAMSTEELQQTTTVLLQMQRRGNRWSQDVWNTLWTQWGRVDPEKCLSMAKGTGLNTDEDYKDLMAGWLEAAPTSALKWVNETQHDKASAAAAAFAIISNTDGDPKKMESEIFKLGTQPEVARACLQDYFDILVSSDGSEAVPNAYEKMPSDLRTAAWPLVMQRLCYSDPGAAQGWLEVHVSDPGRDYAQTFGLISSMAGKDAKGTLDWAINKLPPQNAGDPDVRFHPASVAFVAWSKQDPKAANGWISAQPANSPWTTLKTQISNQGITPFGR